MGYKARGFSLSANFRARDELASEWLRGDLVRRVFLAPLVADRILPRCDHVAVELEDPVPFRSIDEVLARADAMGYQTLEVLSGSDPSDPDCYVNLGLGLEGPRTFVALAPSIVAEYGNRLVELANAWIQGWSAKLGDDIVLRAGTFEPHDEFPHVEPRPKSMAWHFGSLIQYVGLSWHRGAPERAAILDRLLRAPLPPGAHRVIDGDVLRLSFLDRIDDPAAVAAARSQHEVWLGSVVTAPPSQVAADAADILLDLSGARPRDPLTLYDERTRTGYKGIVVEPDGSVDEGTWEDMLEIVRGGALPDGTPVASLRLIVPRREDGITILDRALADGFEMVVYPSGSRFWQIIHRK